MTTHHFWHILLVRSNSWLLPTFSEKRLHKSMNTRDEYHKSAFKIVFYPIILLFFFCVVDFFSRSLNIFMKTIILFENRKVWFFLSTFMSFTSFSYVITSVKSFSMLENIRSERRPCIRSYYLSSFSRTLAVSIV